MFEAFKIGVELVGINGASHVIGAVTRDIMKLAHELEATNSKFKGLTQTMELGFAGILGGGAILGGLYKMQEAGREQAHIQQELITSGLKQADVAKMVGKAWEMAQTKRDFSSDQYLEMLVESRGQFKDIPSLMKAAPSIADFMTDVKLGDSKVDPKGMIQDAIKTIAVRGMLYKADGSLNESAIQNEMDWMGRATRFTHGQINPHTLRQTATQAGPLSRGMSAEAFYGWGAEVQNTLGASKTGTALGSLATQLMGGVMPKYVAEHLMSVGWLKAGKVHFKGAHANLDPDALDDAAGFSGPKGNPFLWLKNHIDDAAKRDHITPQQEVFRDFGRQTSMRLGSDVDANFTELSTAFEQQKKAWGAGDTAAQARAKDPDTIMRSFTASWTDFIKALGSPMVDPVNGMLIKVTNTVRDMTAWVNANQGQVLYLEKAAAIVGGLFIAGGVVALLGAGLTLLAAAFAPFALGAAAAAAMVFIYGPAGFSAVAASFDILKRAVQDFVSWFHTQNFSLSNVVDGAKTVLGIGPDNGNASSARIHQMQEVNDLLVAQGKAPKYSSEDIYGKPKGLTNVTSSLSSGSRTTTTGKVMLGPRQLGDFVIDTVSGGWPSSPDGMTGFDRRGTPTLGGSLVGAH